MISNAWGTYPSKGFEKEWSRREIDGGEGESAAAVTRSLKGKKGTG
jgi:hypothetical protein